MKKYTFIAEYKGGTYISQYKSEDLIRAYSIWVENLDRSIFTKKDIEKINFDFLKDEFKLIAIDNIDNVWCNFLSLGRHHLLLNIIETI